MTTNDPGGPLNSTKPLVLMIYQTAFSSYDMGYAAAQTVVLFLDPAGRLAGPALRPEETLTWPPTSPHPRSPANRAPHPRPAGSSPGRCCFIGGLLMVTPLLFMFSTSLKTAGQVYDLRLIPAAPTLDNYVEVLADGRFLRWFVNSTDRRRPR